MNKKDIKGSSIEVISWKKSNKQQFIENLREKNWSNFNDMNISEKLKLLRKSLMRMKQLN